MKTSTIGFDTELGAVSFSCVLSRYLIRVVCLGTKHLALLYEVLTLTYLSYKNYE